MPKLDETARRYAGTLRALLRATAAAATAAATLWWSAPQTAAQDPPKNPPEQLQVVSGQLLVDDQTQKARFEGDVTATWGEWTLRCHAINVTYGENGQIIEALAEGSPLRLSWSGGVIEAKRARFAPKGASNDSLTQGSLWLEGDPVLRRGQSRLKGREVEVDLKTRRVRVVDVQGVLAPQDF